MTCRRRGRWGSAQRANPHNCELSTGTTTPGDRRAPGQGRGVKASAELVRGQSPKAAQPSRQQPSPHGGKQIGG
eukprot:8385179-Alexandrium_andersonii.AAC.1